MIIIGGKKKKKESCLVVLHHPPLIFENWKVFTVQKCTTPDFQNSTKVFFSLRILILKKKKKKKKKCSTCLHFNTGLKLA